VGVIEALSFFLLLLLLAMKQLLLLLLLLELNLLVIRQLKKQLGEKTSCLGAIVCSSPFVCVCVCM